MYFDLHYLFSFLPNIFSTYDSSKDDHIATSVQEPAVMLDEDPKKCESVTQPQEETSYFWRLFKPIQYFIESLNQELAVNGVVGSKEQFADRRIVFVNGILNTSNDCLETAKEISDIFDKEKIYFTYNPSHGLIGDISNMLRGLFFGSFLCAAEKLAENIKERLQDLKNSRNDSDLSKKKKIILIAHSGGGIILNLAMKLLSEKEMNKLCVYTFGYGVVFPKENFSKVKNYISRSDPIPSICHTFQGHLLRYPGPVKKLGTCWKRPGSTHMLLTSDYKGALMKLRKKLDVEEKEKN